jgi:hypothetical protein
MSFLRGLVIGMVIAMTAVVIWFRFSRLPEKVLPPPAAPPVVAKPAEPVKLAPAVVSRDPVETPTIDERTERNQARPEGGTGENQLEHLLRSVVNANAEALKLTPDQVNRLASDYLEFQEIYAEQVSRFIQETSFDPTSVSVKIPPYPVEGKLLRDMFYERLKTDFTDRSADIHEQLGGFFDNAFRGFGETEQSFSIKRSPEVPNAFEVQWDAKLPEGAPANTANSDTGFAGSSGTTLLYREQVQTGDFRFLGGVIERRFPDTAGGSSPR